MIGPWASSSSGLPVSFWLSEALVKSRKNDRIRHNFTRTTCFYNSDTAWKSASLVMFSPIAPKPLVASSCFFHGVRVALTA